MVCCWRDNFAFFLHERVKNLDDHAKFWKSELERKIIDNCYRISSLIFLIMIIFCYLEQNKAVERKRKRFLVLKETENISEKK